MADWRRACVYTCLIGRYENFNEQPVAAHSQIPFICFTDDASLESSTWRLIRIDPLFPMDSARSQRMIKLLPHRFLPDFDASLYIDNSVILTEKPEDILDRYLASSDFALPTHSFRDRVIDEFVEVAKLGLDDQARISEQLEHYRSSDPAMLNERPYWSAIQLRRHRSAEVQRAMENWFAHVLRYSGRDQLSSHAAFRQSKVIPDRFDIDNYQSWFHTWPHNTGRAARPTDVSVEAKNGLLQQQVHDLDEQLAQALAQIEQHAATIATMESSRSWRLTSPLRSLHNGWSRLLMSMHAPARSHAGAGGRRGRSKAAPE